MISQDTFEIRKQTPEASSDQEEHFTRNAEILFANGDWSLARVIYSKLHEMNREKAFYLERLGDCYKELGEYENASIAFEQLSETYPCFRSYILSGNHFLEVKNFVKSKKYYHKAICHQEEDYTLLFDMFKNLGNLSLHEGDFEQAEEYYNKAHSIFSGSDLLFVNYGSLYLQKKEFEKARESFQNALSINPKSDKARLGLALLFREAQDLEMAWGNLEAAMECDEKNVSVLKMAAQWALNDFRYDSAREYLERFVSKNEYHQEINVLLACLYYQSGFREEAFWECEKILNFDPDNADALKLMQILEKAGV